jgi:hypothetical protein
MDNDTQWLGPLEPGEEGYEEYKKQYNEALEYLANKTIMDNATQNGIELDKAAEDQDSNLETEVEDGQEVATAAPPEEVAETSEATEEEEKDDITAVYDND